MQLLKKAGSAIDFKYHKVRTNTEVPDIGDFIRLSFRESRFECNKRSPDG